MPMQYISCPAHCVVIYLDCLFPLSTREYNIMILKGHSLTSLANMNELTYSTRLSLECSHLQHQTVLVIIGYSNIENCALETQANDYYFVG